MSEIAPLGFRDMSASSEDYRLTAIVVVGALLIVGLVVSAIDFGSVDINGLPAVTWCAIIAFGVVVSLDSCFRQSN